MATKKKKTAIPGTGLFRSLLKGLMIPGLLLAGALLGNLDRLDQTGIFLLKFKSFIPYQIRRFLPGGGVPEGRAEPRTTLKGKIIEVYDGDTATLLTADKKYRVRFYGIDAPEADQESGIEARDALRKKILGKEVTVAVMNTDHYGRAVGRVLLGDQDVNLEQLRSGWAWYYSDYARDEVGYARAEQDARNCRIGLWQKNNPQPPWEYRRTHKK